jgi:beta-1,4-mannosyl-glycoprotein beta-1,4-N-acetylglucosaminyltransferase
MIKIVDGFLFFNEIQILSFKLKELNEIIDYFVIVESPQTFSGNPKPLYYEENKHLFSEYSHKIIHIIAEETQNLSAWDRESFQRNKIMEGINSLNLTDSDIIIIDDCDEITNPKLLAQIKHYSGFNIFKNNNNVEFFANSIDNYKTEEIFGLIQDFYYYHLESKKVGVWGWARILTYKKLKEIKEPQKVRREYDVKGNWYYKGGWHFSYFGGIDQIFKKVQSFAHTEYNNEIFLDKEKILNQILNYKDLFFRENENIIYCPISENNHLPKNYKMLLNNV